MKKRRKWLAALMTFAMLVTMLPAGAFAQEGTSSETVGQPVSKSKTATNLELVADGETYTSDVTLSLPAEDEQLVSDVVFVLDGSTSTSKLDINNLLTALQDQVSETNADVKVGVVKFDATATVELGLTSISDEAGLQSVQDAVTNISHQSGTNINAGVLAGKEMLDSDTVVADGRKYLILVSDGLSYYYCKGEDYNTAYTISSLNGGNDGEGNGNCQPNSSLSAWEIKYGSTYDPAKNGGWQEWMDNVEKVMDSEYSQYEYSLNDPDIPQISDYDDPGSVPFKDRASYPINVDLCLYNSYQLFEEMKNEGYNCYSVYEIQSEGYSFGPSFMEFLGGDNFVDETNDAEAFEKIQNDINYLLDRDSYVVDEIGSGTDNDGNGYNFDFVQSDLTLTVGDETLTASPETEGLSGDETAQYTFGDDRFVLHYYKDGTTIDGEKYGECFKWDINEAVSQFAPVQLTYTVELTNPQTDAGAYGEYDPDGSLNKSSLYTNNVAKLFPVDTQGTEGTPEEFGKPTVSYTVQDSEPLVITPANMTVYTGGDSYSGVVDDTVSDDGEDVHVSTGLPEPGYYLTLPDEVNEQLNITDESEGVTDEGANNLSNNITFVYDEDDDGTLEREWPIALYYVADENDNVEGTSYEKGVNINDVVRDRYIYQLQPSGDNYVRVQFTPKGVEGADPILSDDFTLEMANLYQEYDMTIYPGMLNSGKIRAIVTDEEGNEIANLPVEVGTGTLTVRGTTNGEVVTGVGTDTNAVTANTQTIDDETASTITAVANESVDYYINNTMVSVNPADVHLLADELVVGDGAAQAQGLLKDYMVENGIAADDANYSYQYLDLVDDTNGRAWVTPTSDVDVYWKVPKDASSDVHDFKIVHFPELDRNYDGENTSNIINADTYSVEEFTVDNGGLKVVELNGEEYLTFATDSFSPFVLVWDEKEDEPDNPGGGGTVIVPDDPDEEDPDTPTLNTEDHYSYIVGYPEDYRTGEATDDESLWPVKPQGNITRAEVATIFYRLLTNDARSENWTTANDYIDVAADSWYNTPVSTLSAMGIVRGYEDGSFRPNASITRAEFAAIAVRFFESDAVNYEEGLFTDIAGSEWFADAVQAAKDHDIIGGYPDGTFKPNNPITRAEACSIVNRTTKRVPDADHLLAEDQMRNWPDNANTEAWYYADMQEATNGHYYDYVLDDNEEIVREEWTSIREPIDWDAVEAELEASH